MDYDNSNMNVRPVPTRLSKVLADVFDVSTEVIKPDLRVGQIEAWDSFGHLQAILAIETEYGVRFAAEKIPQLTSVASLQDELANLGV